MRHCVDVGPHRQPFQLTPRPPEHLHKSFVRRETRDDDGAETSAAREELDKDRAAEQDKVHVQLNQAVPG